jgi:hypothetical protein
MEGTAWALAVGIAWVSPSALCSRYRSAARTSPQAEPHLAQSVHLYLSKGADRHLKPRGTKIRAPRRPPRAGSGAGRVYEYPPHLARCCRESPPGNQELTEGPR